MYAVCIRTEKLLFFLFYDISLSEKKQGRLLSVYSPHGTNRSRFETCPSRYSINQNSIAKWKVIFMTTHRFMWPVDGLSSWDKHISNEQTTKAVHRGKNEIFREEMKWLVRNYRREQLLSIVSHSTAFPGGAPFQRVTHLVDGPVDLSLSPVLSLIALDTKQTF